MIETFVRNLLAPVYKYMGASEPFIIGIIVVFIVFYLFSKIKARVKARFTKKYKVGTTNEWFRWDDYHEYIREIEERKKGKK